MTREISLAVVGATGLVGEALLEQLAESGLALGAVHAVASAESAGKRIEFGDRLLKVSALDDFDFSAVEMALFAVPPAVSAAHARRAAEQGCRVLDLSGVWLADPSVPAWCGGVPDIDEDLAHQRLVSVLTGPAAIVAEVLAALEDLSPVQASCTSLQPASAGGRALLEDLARQTARLLNSQDPEPQLFPAQAAFSVLATGSAGLGSATLAPAQSLETGVRRLAPLADVEVMAQSAWVPAFYGASVALEVGFAGPVTAELAAQLLADAGLPAAGTEAAREARSLTADLPNRRPLIGDLRVGGAMGTRLGCWIGFDNVRYGAARKGVQIVELLLKDYL